MKTDWADCFTDWTQGAVPQRVKGFNRLDMPNCTKPLRSACQLVLCSAWWCFARLKVCQSLKTVVVPLCHVILLIIPSRSLVAETPPIPLSRHLPGGALDGAHCSPHEIQLSGTKRRLDYTTLRRTLARCSARCWEAQMINKLQKKYEKGYLWGNALQ